MRFNLKSNKNGISWKQIILHDTYMSRRFRYDVLLSVDKSSQLRFYFSKVSSEAEIGSGLHTRPCWKTEFGSS